MTPVSLEPAASRSRVKHSTTEPLHSRSGSVVECLTRDQEDAGLERSGSVVECLTGYRGAAGLSLTGVTALRP